MDGGGTYNNLLCAHPPFQLDGNMGGTAGIAEMLLPSHGKIIHILPALPDVWSAGRVRGLRARGDFTLDFSWKEGKFTEGTIQGAPGAEGYFMIEKKEEYFRIPSEGILKITAK